jgi:hypothetical protein
MFMRTDAWPMLRMLLPAFCLNGRWRMHYRLV